MLSNPFFFFFPEKRKENIKIDPLERNILMNRNFTVVPNSHNVIPTDVSNIPSSYVIGNVANPQLISIENPFGLNIIEPDPFDKILELENEVKKLRKENKQLVSLLANSI